MLKKWFSKKPESPGEIETARPPESPPEPLPTDGAEAAADRPRRSLFSRALEKTRKGLRGIFTFHGRLDEDLLAQIEGQLYSADFGPQLVAELLDGPAGVRAAWKAKEILEAEQVRDFLKARLKEMLTRRESSLAEAPQPPTVVLVAGVNGTGKTTSIAKLTKLLRDRRKSVVLAAADTFRAAAVEQLTIWSQRLGVDIVTGDSGADPGSVAYRSAEAALEKKADYLIVDTAGRLHTQKNLMRELHKIRNVLAKKIPESPHESLLVLDATTGQNALSQARTFLEQIQISGIVLAKLDGTAKGGIVVAINNTLDIPVKFIGVGEKLGDLEPFDVDGFVDALFE